MTKNNNLIFELSTDPEIIRYTHVVNAESWRSKLTTEQYADREWHTGCQSKIGKRKIEDNLGLYHFVLRDLTLSNDTKFSSIVASCETMNRKGWKIAPNGELKEVISACVGGVYTNPKFRGKGYATQLINSLNKYWDDRLNKDGFIFLYSEVGNYYERFGYHTFEVPLHEINIPEDYETTVDSSNFHSLKYEEYSKVIEFQYKNLKDSLIAKSKETNKILFSLIPDLDIYSWFHDRDLFISKALKPELNVSHFGVLSNDGSMDHIIWLHDWNSGHLTILSVSASSEERFKELFECAIKEARQYEMHEISIWDSNVGSKSHYSENLKFIESFKGSKTFQPNGSISAIRPLDGTSSENFCWEANEKWCWF